jgi:hypothetical protein
MSKGNTFENDILLLIFNNTNAANIGDATGLRGSTAVGSLYFGIHTADPGEAGDQTTNECNYGGYARVAVARSGAGFTVTGNNVVNAAIIPFPACTSGANSATHWSVGTSPSGVGKILYKGALGTAIAGPFTGKASTDAITIPGHTLAIDDRVAFFPSAQSSLPTGITEGTLYFVKTVTGNDITIAATSGGTVIDITADGDGVAIKALKLDISTGITPQYAAGQWSLFED